MFQPDLIRAQFPFLSHHPGLACLDNAATTHKPRSVVRAVCGFYEKANANVHRGMYRVAADAGRQFETVRQKVAQYIGAPDPGCIVYTSGTTHSINLVAQSFLAPRLRPGDEVVITIMEHHANFIPWQQLCVQKKARLRIVPLTPAGELDWQAFKNMLTAKTKMVALAHVSNTLGTVNPIGEAIFISHKKNIPVLVDAAQSAAHYTLNVQQLDVDFLAFSAHKIYGPTGVGILYAKKELLENMLPVRFGGGAVKNVETTHTDFANPPHRFEPGTQNMAGIAGLGSAIDFLNGLNKKEVRLYLKKLTQLATEKLNHINGLHIMGTAPGKAPVISFVFENIHPHDMATFLSAESIAVRAGHHCAQPLMHTLGLSGATRASFAVYNTPDEVERLAAAVKEAQTFFEK